jgi:HTH-type transcriptional regulator/antitoxin HigA
MTGTLDYPELLAEAKPEAITNERAHKDALARVEALMDKLRLTKAESRLLDLMLVLVEAYEDRFDPIADADPIDVLRELMATRELRQADLVEVLGSSGLVSEILSGKRGLSKAHIGKLAMYFHVSPSVFLR